MYGYKPSVLLIKYEVTVFAATCRSKIATLKASSIYLLNVTFETITYRD